MKFVDKLFKLLSDGFNTLIHAFTTLFKWLGKIIGYLVEFFEGIFYFIWKIFEVAIAVVKIFVALFQFIFALGAGIFRTIKSWITVSPQKDLSFPSVSMKGFSVVTDILQGTGILTVVPMVALAFLWFFFVLKMIGLFGGQIMIAPEGRPPKK